MKYPGSVIAKLLGHWLSLCITCFLIVTGCTPKIAPTEKQWDYQSFEFTAGDKFYWQDQTNGPESRDEPMAFYDIGRLLTRINSRGRELAWTDGHQFIVRAEAGQHGKNRFTILKQP